LRNGPKDSFGEVDGKLKHKRQYKKEGYHTVSTGGLILPSTIVNDEAYQGVDSTPLAGLAGR
jgi:hypothetical protein